MCFNVAAESYDRFMGRYSTHLSAQLADLAGVAAGQTVIDVGCGPGALTEELARRVGPAAVSAVEPSERFVAAARERNPGVRIERAQAESLPFPDDGFDAAIAQLVVHFMDDPVAGLAEMARVTRPGGVVATCVWDHAADGQGPLSPFYRAGHKLDPGAPEESGRAGTRKGHLGELFRAAGLRDVTETTLTIKVVHASFEDYWAPFALGVGTIGTFVSDLDADQREQLRELCRQELPPEPFVIEARAWAARGVAA